MLERPCPAAQRFFYSFRKHSLASSTHGDESNYSQLVIALPRKPDIKLSGNRGTVSQRRP